MKFLNKDFMNHICPSCGSDDLQYGESTVQEESYYVETSCDKCGFEWDCIYRLVGIIPQKPEPLDPEYIADVKYHDDQLAECACFDGKCQRCQDEAAGKREISAS